MSETIYFFMGLIIYTVVSFALGFMLGMYRGKKFGSPSIGVVTGKDAERFHKIMDENNKKQAIVDLLEENKRIPSKYKAVVKTTWRGGKQVYFKTKEK